MFVVWPVWAWQSRISPPRILAECHEKRLNRVVSFICFVLFAFSLCVFWSYMIYTVSQKTTQLCSRSVRGVSAPTGRAPDVVMQNELTITVALTPSSTVLELTYWSACSAVSKCVADVFKICRISVLPGWRQSLRTKCNTEEVKCRVPNSAECVSPQDIQTYLCSKYANQAECMLLSEHFRVTVHLWVCQMS